MWSEALHLLQRHVPLSVIDEGRIIRLSREEGAASSPFRLSLRTPETTAGDAGEGEGEPITHHFDDPWLALIAFVELVGHQRLLRAVGAARYAALFPLDSSLTWTPVPLQSWQPLSAPLPRHATPQGTPSP